MYKNSYKKWCVVGWGVCLLILIAFYSPAFGEKMQQDTLTPKPPRYELRLTPGEMAVFDRAAQLGVGKYGVEANFAMKLAKHGDQVVYTVTTRDPRLIQNIEHWMAEETARLLSQLDLKKLDANNTASLQTVKSVTAKIARARDNPIWDPVKVSGTVIESDQILYIRNDRGKYLIAGNRLEDIKKVKDKPVVVTGLVKVKDQIEVVRFLEKRKNTIEMFVTSLDPATRKAGAILIDYLSTLPEDIKPSLEIRYIFYKVQDGEKTYFTSSSGGEEVLENLAQMIIRDNYSDLYYPYLLKRAKRIDSWEVLAQEVGMTKEDIKAMGTRIKKEGAALVDKEYRYVTENYGIYDGSPAYVWESERVRDIREVETFKRLEFK